MYETRSVEEEMDSAGEAAAGGEPTPQFAAAGISLVLYSSSESAML